MGPRLPFRETADHGKSTQRTASSQSLTGQPRTTTCKRSEIQKENFRRAGLMTVWAASRTLALLVGQSGSRSKPARNAHYEPSVGCQVISPVQNRLSGVEQRGRQSGARGVGEDKQLRARGWHEYGERGNHLILQRKHVD